MDRLGRVWLTWRVATGRALYGERGFYRRERPSAHFRTAVHASPRYAAALVRLLESVDADLGRPARLDLVDVGAGRAELLAQMIELAGGDLADRLHPVAVEFADRPDGLDPLVSWRRELPDRITGLVVASEWLDNIPVDVVELAADGVRLVLVDPATGAQRLGRLAASADLAWLARWWPLPMVGHRAEVGRPRDMAWARVVRRLRAGMAVAVDYVHDRDTRPPYGSLSGYRGGRAIEPVPDGSCDITSHVAIDACAAAGTAAGAAATLCATQRDALRALGVRGRRPPPGLADTHPVEYRHQLAAAGEAAELTEPGGLGGFGWLVQTTGTVRASVLTCADGGDGADVL
ncbi:MAG: SAM-dependent methyltransferase [Mycobacterium sp.]